MSFGAGSSPALDIRGLSKTYAGTRALHGVSLTVGRGRIHGLVGRNGSGKSTLIKVLSGFIAPDAGEIEVFGTPLSTPVTPTRARSRGLAFVQQDLALAPGLSVRDNVRVGRYSEPSLAAIPRRRERDLVSRALAAVGLEVDPDLPVSCLSPVERTLVAIARALAEARGREGPTMLVLDEPTSQLPVTEIERLFTSLRRLAATGDSIVLVTHRIDEIFAITDAVTVLRDGELVTSGDIGSFTPDQLVELMLGEPLTEFYPELPPATGDPRVTIRGLRGQGWGPIDVELRGGEIVGVTGLPGMGHERLPRALFGVDSDAAGELIVDGDPQDIATASPERMMAAGVAYLPADRTRESGAGAFTVRENLTLPVIDRFVRALWLSRGAELDVVRSLLGRFRVEPPDPERLMSQLSGGNQQKALLAKWFQLPPKLFIVHEPTQGIDVAAKTEVFRQLIGLAEHGTAVLFVSVEHKDLANVCHRVLVMRHGRIVDELSGGALTEASVAQSALDVRSAA